MKASLYTTLTEGLKALTLEIKYHSKADPSEFWAVYDTMLECRDDFVEENQDRADRKVGISRDGQRLFDAMGRFLNAIETPIGKGDSLLCFEVCRMCQDWRGRMVEWFPDLNANQGGNRQPTDGDTSTPPTTDRQMMVENWRSGLLNNQEYKNAKDNKHIKPPFTWLGSNTELADWLDSNDLIPKDPPKPGPLVDYKCLWRFADGAFTNTNGEPITAKQLTDAMKELKRPKRRPK